MTQTVRDNTCRIATLVAIAFVIQTANAPAQEKKSLPRDLKKTIRKPDPRKTPPKADNTKLVQPKHKIGIPEPTVVLKPGEVPKIEFDNNGVFNFGRMKGGDAILHDFWFKNTGTGPLELLKVKPACGCTKASEHDRIVQPGERGKIPIKMATDKFNGPVSKTVTVHTNAPDAGSKITLRIKGDVWQVVSVTPAQMYFGRLSQQAISEKPLKKKVVIKNNVLAHAKLTNVRSSNPAFKPEIKTLEEGKRFELEVTVGETTRSGPNNGNIEIDTGLADKPTIKIPVSLFLAAA
ncbi:MAG: DUF1573 domain-containing protein, partial [Desulfovibrionales bacterium]|nr:DUF1573 domain-containing protein [Desulfovibrionales bacterium]